MIIEHDKFFELMNDYDKYFIRTIEDMKEGVDYTYPTGGLTLSIGKRLDIFGNKIKCLKIQDKFGVTEYVSTITEVDRCKLLSWNDNGEIEINFFPINLISKQDLVWLDLIDFDFGYFLSEKEELMQELESYLV